MDLLERAAATLRELAQAATSGPWEVIEDVHRGYPEPAREISVWSQPEDRYVTEDVTNAGSLDRWRANAQHIAIWSPTNALLVADWLEGEAATVAAMEPLADLIGVTIQHTSGNSSHVDVGRAETGSWRMHARTDSFALALARSILQEDT
ncbi:hypothetical protein [Nocardioides nitrophenolicus]|uniref:hypothetical protein n=1 Tax=Nocardioides nitrophenolicus TaxID=60489 RepID=UPI00195EB7F4|nr:hypothetical protein [Nocardioides nitrophenolicus]MBM7518296.1 hypothetical protein [Nocardioides nitrophenolicus]